MLGTLESNNIANSSHAVPALEMNKVPMSPERCSDLKGAVAQTNTSKCASNIVTKSLLVGEVAQGRETEGQSHGNEFVSDDDSTIAGSDWGSEASDDDAYDLAISNHTFNNASDENNSFMSSLDGSLDQDYDNDSCVTFDDYSYDGETEEEAQHRQVDPSSRFYSVPAKRMSIGEMETVMDTVFRSFNSLSQTHTKKPSERKLSFAAAMVEQQIFDKSAPACETARGCLTRMESWAKRSDDESVCHDVDGEVEDGSGNGSGSTSTPGNVNVSNRSIVSIGSTSSKPKKLKSILKLFPRFSKPKPAGTLYPSERNMGSNYSCMSTPNPQRPSLFGRRTNSKSYDIASPIAPTRPRRQLSLRSLFEGDSSNHDTEQEDICALFVPALKSVGVA